MRILNEDNWLNRMPGTSKTGGVPHFPGSPFLQRPRPAANVTAVFTGLLEIILQPFRQHSNRLLSTSAPTAVSRASSKQAGASPNACGQLNNCSHLTRNTTRCAKGTTKSGIWALPLNSARPKQQSLRVFCKNHSIRAREEAVAPKGRNGQEVAPKGMKKGCWFKRQLNWFLSSRLLDAADSRCVRW